MARKGSDSSPRGRGRRTDFMASIRRGERAFFVALSKLIVVFLFFWLAVISVAEGSAFVAALASVGAFITAAVLLPIDELRAALDWFASGAAGEWLHNTYLRIMPGRSPGDRRGQSTARSLFALAAVVLVVSSLIFGGLSGVATAEGETDATAVEHDYRDDGYAQTFGDDGYVEMTDRNVKTTIEETSAFVRVTVDNPNSYPVEMTMKVHPEIIPPADVGEVTASDGDTESTWRNTHDFERDESYTEISFTIDANSEATFAPSRVRVMAVSWKDSSTDPEGFLDRVPNPFEDEDLEDRTYELNSSAGSTVTVPLENGDRSIDDWQAVYRTGPDEKWKPISTDSSDPAFYQTVDDGSAVQFHFDTDNYPEGQIEVEFTANPNLVDQARHDYRSFMAGLSDMVGFDFLPSITVPTVLIAEVVR